MITITSSIFNLLWNIVPNSILTEVQLKVNGAKFFENSIIIDSLFLFCSQIRVKKIVFQNEFFLSLRINMWDLINTKANWCWPEQVVCSRNNGIKISELCIWWSKRSKIVNNLIMKKEKRF